MIAAAMDNRDQDWRLRGNAQLFKNDMMRLLAKGETSPASGSWLPRGAIDIAMMLCQGRLWLFAIY